MNRWFRYPSRRSRRTSIGPRARRTLHLEFCEPRLVLSGATLTWTGAVDANWSTAGNWKLPDGTHRMPANGDSLLFPDNAAHTTNMNDISGLSLHSLTFAEPGGSVTHTTAYVITGDAITIGAGGIINGINAASSSPREDQLNLDITLGASQAWLMGTTAPAVSPAQFETLAFGGTIATGTFNLNFDTDGGAGNDQFLLNGTVNGNGKLTAGTQASSHVVLGGTGTVSVPMNVSSGSTLRPGGANAATDTGTFNSAGGVTLQQASNFAVQLNGTAADEFDQLASTGSVDLGNATLDLNVAGSFPAGSTFVLVKSGAPITTTFLNLPEGSTTFAGSQNFTVSYQNDEATLTVPGATTPTTITWTGKSLTDSNWSDAANWDLNRAPIDGDSLVFPANAERLTNTNDVLGLSVNTIQFQGSFGTSTAGYTIGGDALTLGAGGIVDDSTFTGNSGNLLNQINLNVALSALQSWAIHDANNGHHLTVNGNVDTGNFGLIATGDGTIDIPGAVSGSGSLTVAAADGSSLITLDLRHANAYTGGTQVINGILDVFADGALGPGGKSDAGTVVTSEGSLFLHSVTYATPEAIALDGILGNESGNSSFAGPITISGSASGKGNGLPIAVDAQVQNFATGTFTLNGPTLVNNGTAALFVQGGNTAVGGGSNVAIDNVISGAGGLLMQGVNLQLGAANTYQGTSFLNGAAQLTVGVDQAVPSTSAVTMQSSGSTQAGASFDNSNVILLGGQSDTFGSLSGAENGGTNTVDLGNNGTLSAGGDNSSTSFVGDIKGSGTLIKLGGGTFDLAAANDFSGKTEVQSGTLLVDGSTAADNQIEVDSNDTTLGGAGTVAGTIAIAPASNLSPGAFPDPSKNTATLTNTAGVSLNFSGSDFAVQLGGTAANPTNDLLTSTGALNLGTPNSVDTTGATLDLTALPGAGPFNVGQQFVIVQAGQPITTTFANLPEGSTVSDGSQNFTVSYANDRVTLTTQAPSSGGQTATYLNGQPGDGTAATFVDNLYRELLGREADSGGESYWTNLFAQLAASGSNASAQQALVAGFLASAEYHQHLVTGMFRDLLHRDPDAGGLAYWTSVLDSEDEKQVLTEFLGSDEYYIDAGQTTSGFVSALYRDVLGRPADSGISFWLGLFSSPPLFFPPVSASPGFRTALAEVFLSTPEANHKLLNGSYPGAAGNVGAPSTPAVGAFALADLTGDGWENLYFQGDLRTANVDALFASLQLGAAYDDTIATMLEMTQYFS